MVTGFFVFFGAARLASGSTKKVNKFGFFDKKTAQRQSLSGIFLIYFVVLHEIFFIRSCFSGIYRKNSVGASIGLFKELFVEIVENFSPHIL